MYDGKFIYRPNELFWKVYPEIFMLKEFKDFYDSDKTRGKSWSNKVFWAIAAAYVKGSPLFNVTDKYSIIASDILNKPGFNWIEDPKIKVVIDIFKDSILSPARKSLANLNDLLKKRDDFLTKQEYTLDSYEIIGGKHKLIKGNADQLDKMHAQTSKIYAQYFQIMKELDMENSKKPKGSIGGKMEDDF